MEHSGPEHPSQALWEALEIPSLLQCAAWDLRVLDGDEGKAAEGRLDSFPCED